MPLASDPFEAFRKARAREGMRPSPARDRQRFARAISGIIETVVGRDEVGDPDGEPIEVPARREIDELVSLLAEIARDDPDVDRQARASALLAGFVAAGQRVLDGPRRNERMSEGREYELGFPDLLEFMRDPDVRRLDRRGS